MISCDFFTSATGRVMSVSWRLREPRGGVLNTTRPFLLHSKYLHQQTNPTKKPGREKSKLIHNSETSILHNGYD